MHTLNRGSERRHTPLDSYGRIWATRASTTTRRETMNLNEQIKRLLSEAIENAAQRCLDEAMAMEPLTIYSNPEWGFDPNKTVEGSIARPITDEGRLLK